MTVYSIMNHDGKYLRKTNEFGPNRFTEDINLAWLTHSEYLAKDLAITRNMQAIKITFEPKLIEKLS